MVQEFPLQVYARPTGDLEYHFEALAAQDSYTDECIWGTGQDSYLPDDGSELCVVCGALTFSVAELYPPWARPGYRGELEVLYGLWVRDGEIASTVAWGKFVWLVSGGGSGGISTAVVARADDSVMKSVSPGSGASQVV